jgi:ribose transport system substrate-binding protein
VTPRSRLTALMLIGCASLIAGVAASTAGTPVPGGYKGAEASLPTAYAKPAKKAGAKCTIGYQNPNAQNETLASWQKGAEAEAKVYGCKLIALDDKLSPDQQVTNMQQLLAQKVNVIIFYPLDPKATIPILKQAKAKGVPILAVDGTFGSPKASAPYLPYIASQVWQGRDIQAYIQMRELARQHPHAKVGLIGIGAPVPALKYLTQRQAFWAKKFGLTVLGTQDNPTDDVAGGQTAANGLLQRYSDMNAVVGYNDPSAGGAYTAARALGRSITIIGCNGSSDGLAAIKGGHQAGTVQVDVVGWGVQQVYAAYSLITKQHLPLAKIIVRPSRLITKANINSAQSWSAQIKAIR